MAINPPEGDEREQSDGRWADDLDEQMDGGGCTEAWESLTAARDEGGPSASRRGVMKALVGVVGASFTPVMANVASAATGEHIDVRELDGSERDDVIAEMQDTADYQAILDEMESDGWTTTSEDDALVLEFTDNERDVVFETVDEPMEPGDGSEMGPEETCVIEYNNDPDADELCQGVHEDADSDDDWLRPDDAAITTTAVYGREGPGTSYDAVDSWDDESVCRVYGGPVTDDDGYDWYLIDFDYADYGDPRVWVYAGYLDEVAHFYGNNVRDTYYDEPGYVRGGPYDEDGYRYWYIDYSDDGIDDKWINEYYIDESAFQYHRNAEATVDGTEGYEYAGTSYDVIETFEEGEVGLVGSDAYDNDGYKWWAVKFDHAESDDYLWVKEEELADADMVQHTIARTEWLYDGSVYTESEKKPKDEFRRTVKTTSKRDDLVSEAKNNAEFQEVRDAMYDDGYEPKDDSEWEVTDTYDTSADRQNQEVTVPMVPTDGSSLAWNEECSITYSNSPDVDYVAQGLYSERVDPDNDEPYYDQTLWYYSDDEGSVLTAQREIPNFWWCNSVDWGCVLINAGSWASTFGACGTCASGPWGWWACAGCIGAILGSAGAWLKCYPCHY